MSNLIIPKDYTPLLDKIQTEKGIKLIKDFFQQNLATELRLRRVTTPPKLRLADRFYNKK